MLRVALAALLAAAALGCATPYVIHLKDGQTLESKDEPDYDEDAGFYEFEDLRGKHIRVNKDDIVKMEAE